MTCKGTLRQVFICLRPRTPYPHPTMFTVRVYSIKYVSSMRVTLNAPTPYTVQLADELYFMTTYISPSRLYASWPGKAGFIIKTAWRLQEPTP